jgi:hypothetical protein
MSKPGGAGLDDDVSAVVKVRCPDRWPGASKQARKESNLRSSVLETATPPWLEPRWDARMTLCA